MAKILLKYKDSVLKEILLDKKEFTIGRKPTSDVNIDNPAVSGSHARIFKDEEGKFLLEDLNSLNGTFVNGRKISKVILNDGDDIIIGKHNIIFQTEKTDAFLSIGTKRIHTGEETVILDSKVQDQILSKIQGGRAGFAEGREAIGGFIVIEGPSEQSEYEIKDRIASIGKNKKALIKLKGFFAPRVAVLINKKKEGFFITPSGSGKTPKINSKDLTSQYRLKDGDILNVGKLKLQFYLKE